MDATRRRRADGGGRSPPQSPVAAPPAPRVDPEPVTFTEPQFDGDAGAVSRSTSCRTRRQAFLDGSLAHLPWLQEMPDPLTSAMWSSWVEINPATAARLGIGQGDVVEVASAHGTLRTSAMISPGIAPDVLAMPVGQGHQTFTRYASGRGENPVDTAGAARPSRRPARSPGRPRACGSAAWATRTGD